MIRVGLIGTGGISRTHLDFLKSRNDVQITALCDIDEGKLAQAVSGYGGNGYTDLHRMLKETVLDAVWVCTPPGVRREPLLACAHRGVPVFCEKPAERSIESGEEIDRELKTLDAKVQVGYLFRTLPAVRKLKTCIADDKVRSVQSLYICDLGLTRAIAPWFCDKELSGGTLVDQATHNFDLLRFLLGEVDNIQGFARNPVQVKQPGYTIEEVITLSFTFENGIVGNHTHSWLGDSWHNEITLSGEMRFYRIDLNAGRMSYEHSEETLTFEPHRKRAIHDYQNEVFLRQIQSGDWSENPSSYSDALLSLKLTHACDQAIAV